MNILFDPVCVVWDVPVRGNERLLAETWEVGNVESEFGGVEVVVGVLPHLGGVVPAVKDEKMLWHMVYCSILAFDWCVAYLDGLF